jgi:hypothetical protein
LFPEAANSHKSVEKTKEHCEPPEREREREKRTGREEKRRSRARDTEKKRDTQADRRRKSAQEEEKREPQKWWIKFGDHRYHQQENTSGVEDY